MIYSFIMGYLILGMTIMLMCTFVPRRAEPLRGHLFTALLTSIIFIAGWPIFIALAYARRR